MWTMKTHSPWCCKTNRVPNCFACYMASQKEKYWDSVQFFEWETLTLKVDGKWNLSKSN